MPNFIARVYKSWGVQDYERRWVNTYELASDSALAPAMATSILNALAAAESNLYFNNVRFLTATLSTWTPDSDPYNPNSFFTLELSGGGARAGGVDILDSNVCLVIKKQADLGRSGRLFYRGALAEGDVEVGGDGRFRIAATSPVAAGGAVMTSYMSAMAPFLSGNVGGADNLTLRLIGQSTTSQGVVVTHDRAVTALKVGGVTINRRNHRYFDRANT